MVNINREPALLPPAYPTPKWWTENGGKLLGTLCNPSTGLLFDFYLVYRPEDLEQPWAYVRFGNGEKMYGGAAIEKEILTDEGTDPTTDKAWSLNKGMRLVLWYLAFGTTPLREHNSEHNH